MKDYQIYPMKVGEFLDMEKSLFSYQVDAGKKIASPVIAYLIKGPDTLIVVDTGPGDEERALKYHRPMLQPEEMKLDNALKRLGVDPGDVRTVVNTHLHWDHCTGNKLFKNAKIYVQKKELQFAIYPIPTQYVFYEAFQMGLTPAWVESMDRIVAVEGDCELQEGISLVTLPGHTPGFHGVLVHTSGGRYLIASDCVGMLENWEVGTFGLPTPSGIHVNLLDYYATFEKIRSICDYILPGHDNRAFDHPVYPPPQ